MIANKDSVMANPMPIAYKCVYPDSYAVTDILADLHFHLMYNRPLVLSPLPLHSCSLLWHDLKRLRLYTEFSKRNAWHATVAFSQYSYFPFVRTNFFFKLQQNSIIPTDACYLSLSNLVQLVSAFTLTLFKQRIFHVSTFCVSVIYLFFHSKKYFILRTTVIISRGVKKKIKQLEANLPSYHRCKALQRHVEHALNELYENVGKNDSIQISWSSTLFFNYELIHSPPFVCNVFQFCLVFCLFFFLSISHTTSSMVLTHRTLDLVTLAK